MRNPRAFRSRPSDAAVMPLPRDETTPPVTKTYFVGRALTWEASRGGRARAGPESPRSWRLESAARRGDSVPRALRSPPSARCPCAWPRTPTLARPPVRSIRHPLASLAREDRREGGGRRLLRSLRLGRGQEGLPRGTPSAPVPA